MFAQPAPTSIPGLDPSVAIPLDLLLTLIQNHPEDYIDFTLRCVALCDTRIPPYHEANVFEFVGGTHRHYIVSDRVAQPVDPTTTMTAPHPPPAPPTTTAPPPAPPATMAPALTAPASTAPVTTAPPTTTAPVPATPRARSFALIMSESSTPHPYLHGNGVDHIRAWQPAPNSPWWKGAKASSKNGAETMLCELMFDQGLAPLTLIDVVLALSAVRSIDPSYQFDYHNCWWFSRSALLLLMRLSRPHAEAAAVEDLFASVAPFPAIVIPGGLNNSIIIRDAALAHVRFTQLVSCSILGEAHKLNYIP